MRSVEKILEGTHLSPREIDCHDAHNSPYPVEWATGRLSKLAAVFEALRKACGNVPLIVDCGYRTPAHNIAVGGVAHSQHVQGRALDIACPRSLSLFGFHGIATKLASEDSRVGGLGLYDWGIHLDVRPRQPEGGYAFWDFTGRS